MTHITGTIQPVSPVITVGPDSGAAPSAINTWAHDFAHVPAAGGTKLLTLHFQNASFPANNRLEVDLGYGTDVFRAADGAVFWTRPINVNALPGGLVPIRYITDGSATGSAQLDSYGRGESHAGEPGHPSISNCDPFLPGPSYGEPTYDPYWYCTSIPETPPRWENVGCIPDGDLRKTVARSVGMFVAVHDGHLSTCSVTLVGPDLVITAGHCIDASEALTASVTFDYAVNCDGSKPGGYDARFHKVIKLIAWQNDPGGSVYEDYCLLQIRVPPGGLGIPPIPMRHDLPAVGEQVFGIHHPNGAVKKLSRPHSSYATVAASSAASVQANLDVSGGSSGSGLFDTSGRIVGVLSNGPSCYLNYYPLASILQNIAAAPAPPTARQTMIVFDRSGSMSLDAGTGSTKIEEARDAASLFVQLVRVGGGNRLGLVSFSTTPSAPVDFALTPVSPAAKNTLVGAAPYSGGIVGGLIADGATTIGGGLEAARLEFPSPGANPRTILLLTDGLQNTPPMVATVEPGLAGIDVNAIGFGTEASLDGALLTTLTQTHNGLYRRAGTVWELKKFFALAFGDIFEAGALADPEYLLAESEEAAKPYPFSICGEEHVTVVVGWDRDDAPLHVQLRSPGSAVVHGGSPDVEQSTGRGWTFLRVILPHGGERDGVWHVEVARAGGGEEFQPPRVAVRYFVTVIADGGPRLERLRERQRFYTGELLNPLVALKYSDGTFPPNAKVEVTIRRPRKALGEILAEAGLREPETLDADTIPARQATLLALEQSGGPVVDYVEETFELFDDAAHDDGTFEQDGIFGNPLEGVLTAEGNYTLHYRASYGETCTGTRELVRSLHVDAGIDPSRTDVTTTVVSGPADGTRHVIVTIVPRDEYGNRLGPGRADSLTIGGVPGTRVTDTPEDGRDGTYTVPAIWDPSSGQPPGIVIGQPGRPSVTVQEPGAPGDPCRTWKLLFWLLLIVAVVLLLVLVLVLVL